MSTINNIYDRLKGDKVIWIVITLLCVCSILSVYSAISKEAYMHHDGNTGYYLVKQLVLLSVGFFFMYLAYRFNYMFYSKVAPVLIMLAIPLLIGTLFFTTGYNGARRWFTIPIINQSFQPSDFAKLALIIFIARSISRKQDVIKDFKSAFVPLIIPVVIVCTLIAPADLSTAALLFVTCLLMMVIGRVSIKYVILLSLIGIGVLSLLVLLGTIFPEVIRVETWTNRLSSYLGDSEGGWQIRQSKIAIALGGIFGVGPGFSMQRNFIPESYTDFIYSIICEEYGLIGAVTIIALYVTLLFRCTKMVTRCPKTFGSILAIGLCLNIVIQAFAHMAVNVHLLPATGLTLPFVSMGGTSILFTGIALGVILSVSKYVEEYSVMEIMKEEMAVTEEDIQASSYARNKMKHENYY